jgi:RNA polymerase sigma-70 factor (ECF subfamily)
MQRVREGDTRAFSAIFDRHSPEAYSLAYRICGRRRMAEDVVHEAFVSLWRKAGVYEGSAGGLRSSLLSLTRKRAVESVRGAGEAKGGTATAAPVGEGPRRGEADRIRRALSMLPDDQREAIELAYFDGLTHDQIALRLSLPPGTAKSRLRLGLQRLRAVLDDYAAAMDLGTPISYMVLANGTPVYSADEEQIGEVTHVLAVEDEDVFDGVVIAVGADHRFADADDVDRIYEHGLVLKLNRAECEQLPKPSPNPAVIRDDPAESRADIRHEKLRRAWDRISGKY